jgi:hypothetical protein
VRISLFTKVLVPIILIAAAVAATYIAMSTTFTQERTAYDANMEAFSNRSLEIIKELAAAREQLKELEGWREFVQVQHDLNAINKEINALNFGNALSRLDQLVDDVSSGALGPRFQEGRDELIPSLEACVRGLRRKNERARSHLVEFNQKALELLSGFRTLDPVPTEESAPAAAAEAAPPESTAGQAVEGEGEAEPGGETEP